MSPESQFDLQSYNTLAVPSRCEYFFSAVDDESLFAALQWAKTRGLNTHILGGGSNILLPDFVPGLILQPFMQGIALLSESAESLVLEVKAGNNWDALVRYCLERHYFGLENLSLIPGSVGASPIQNIGAYGVEVSQRIKALRVFDREQARERFLSPDDCEFAYRSSIFKTNKNRFIVLSVQFHLSKSPKLNCTYPALGEFLSESKLALTPHNIAQAVRDIRQSKLPQPEQIPNVGSFFKNPIIDKNQYRGLKQELPELVAYAHGNAYKVAAGWLIDHSGWKGKNMFGVAVHDKQALVLTNPNKQSLKNVLQLATAIQSDVYKRFDIRLEVEPQVLGGNCP